MAGLTNLTAIHLEMSPQIVGPDNMHEAVVVQAELAARSCVILKPCSTTTSEVASKIAGSVKQAALATRGDEQAQKKRRMAARSSGDGQASPSHDAGQDDDDKQPAERSLLSAPPQISKNWRRQHDRTSGAQSPSGCSQLSMCRLWSLDTLQMPLLLAVPCAQRSA